jgi:Cdc6-like AAA superfamily ATPase
MNMPKPEEVFTPGIPAVENFVERPELIDRVVTAINTPGKQVVLYGETGVGKTSAAEYVLQKKLRERYVRVQCQPGYSLKDIIASIYDEMQRQFAMQGTRESIGYRGNIEQFDLPLDLSNEPVTPKRLVEICGRYKVTVIVDDYEKLGTQEVKREVANLAKEFSDRAEFLPGRLCIVGIHSSPGEMIQLDESLNRRLSQIPVPVMEEGEIRGILERGFSQLGIHYDQHLINEFVHMAGGYGAFAHDLGLKTARSLISESRTTIVKEDLDKAVTSLVEENKAQFGRIYSDHVQQSSRTMQVRQSICEAIALSDQVDMETSEILERVNEIVSHRRNEKVSLTVQSIYNQLSVLCSNPKRDPILVREGIRGSFRYRFRNLMFKAYVRWRLEDDKRHA